jgi:hypothetical protein
VPVRPFENTKSHLYHHNGHSYYYGNYYTGNKEYYSGNYFSGNYQPTYYYGYINNYNTYYPDNVKLYEKRILDAIDIGFVVSVSTPTQLYLMIHHRQHQSPSLDTILSQFHPPPILTACFPKIHLTN